VLHVVCGVQCATIGGVAVAQQASERRRARRSPSGWLGGGAGAGFSARGTATVTMSGLDDLGLPSRAELHNAPRLLGWQPTRRGPSNHGPTTRWNPVGLRNRSSRLPIQQGCRHLRVCDDGLPPHGDGESWEKTMYRACPCHCRTLSRFHSSWNPSLGFIGRMT
jgi:hypothetical protein